MSFLLDALRKSERAGQRRKAPSIHSPAQVFTTAGRDLEWLPLVLLLVPAFLTMTWLGLEQYGMVPEAAQPTTAQVERSPEEGAPVKSAAQQPELPSPEVADSDPASAGTNGPPGRGGRTPVEQAPDKGPTEDGPGTAAASSPARQRTVAEEVPSRESVRTDSAPSNEQRRGAAAPAVRAPRDNHIDYWDLPAEIRGPLPEFNITVLVYADDPAERFILINGRRQHEGDALQQGLVLEEIRRDGVIYRFRRYRFLVRQ